MNQYAYAGNDPVNYVDPYGTCTLMATVKTTYYSDGSTTVRVLGYFWDGDDCGTGGGETAAAPQKKTARPVKYRAVKSCNIINSVRQGLHNEFPLAQKAGLERGGFYDKNFAFSNTGTNATPGTVRIPVNSGARGYWHTHQNPNLLQGPSDFDSIGVRNAWKAPMIIESIDSLFMIRTDGSSIGCKK